MSSLPPSLPSSCQAPSQSGIPAPEFKETKQAETKLDKMENELVSEQEICKAIARELKQTFVEVLFLPIEACGAARSLSCQGEQKMTLVKTKNHTLLSKLKMRGNGHHLRFWEEDQERDWSHCA